MSSTPSNGRLKLPATPSTNPPVFGRPLSSHRSPMRGRSADWPSRLSLRRVVGTTCSSPTGFDSVHSSFAYIAGGAVVVVDVEDAGRNTDVEADSPDAPASAEDHHRNRQKPRQTYTQRFFRARPSAAPVYALSSPLQNPGASSAPSTPKANDSRNRAPASGLRDVSFGAGSDWGDPPAGGRTWTSRERIKAATCLSLSRDGRFLAVGETGYAPRVLIFSLQDASSDVPLVSISEHGHGVRAVAWSQDTRYLASLGAANDGYIYVWKIDPRTGAAAMFQKNRCTAAIRGMVWMGSTLVTLGVRHVKVWRIDEPSQASPTKQKFQGDPSQQKPLPGRNILLGNLLEATFSCAAVIDETRAVICSDAGDVCLLEDDRKPARLANVLTVRFPVSSVTVRDGTAFVGGRAGQFATLSVRGILDASPDSVLTETEECTGVVALGFLAENLVTIDSSHSIDIWGPSHRPGRAGSAEEDEASHVPIPGHGEPILGIQPLREPHDLGDGAFVTWSASGRVTVWNPDGRIRAQIDVPVEQQQSSVAAAAAAADVINQLTCVRATADAGRLVVADKLGVLRVLDAATGECLLDARAHAADCQAISIFEDATRFLVASCGRDRTVQLFCRRQTDGAYEHVQTLEFPARVVQVLLAPSADRLVACSLDRTVQVFDLVSREGEPDALAAIPSRVVPLKASPTSMTMGPGGRTVFVSLADKSVVQFDAATGKHVHSFRCTDEGGTELAVLESLTLVPSSESASGDEALIIGVSNTDKSVRAYDAQTGCFVGREWGHTEAINGVALLEGGDGDGGRRQIASVGSDGTIMLWVLGDRPDAGVAPSPGGNAGAAAAAAGAVASSAASAASRDPSPTKDEFQRGSSASAPSSARRSPPSRGLRHRPSRNNLVASSRTPPTPGGGGGGGGVANNLHHHGSDDTPTRSTGGGPAGSPPGSPRSCRRPSLAAPATSATAPALGRKKSSQALRVAPGSLTTATEQACRTLRAYRRRVSSSSEPIGHETLAELDQELRLTVAALSDRTSANDAMSETVFSGLLDLYSVRLVSMLEEKLGLGLQPRVAAAAEGDATDDGRDSSAETEPGSLDGRKTEDDPAAGATVL